MVAEIDVKPRLSLNNSGFKSKTPVECSKKSPKYVVKVRLMTEPGLYERQDLIQQNGSITQHVVEQVVQLTGKAENVDDILGTAVNLVERAFDAKCCLVWQSSDQNSKVCYVSHSTKAKNLIHLCGKLSDNYGYSLNKGRLISLQGKENLSPPLKAAMEKTQINSFVLAPLYKNAYRGEICLCSSQERQWTEAELKTIRSVATQCAIAIEQVQLAVQVQQQQLKANLLKEISRTINSALELKQVLPAVLEKVGRNFGAERVVLFCQNEKELQIWGEWQVSSQILDSMTLILEADFADGNDAQLNKGAKHTAQLDYAQIRQRVPKTGCFDYGSILSVPVFIRGEFFGSLVLYTTTTRTFTAEEISLVESVVDQIAIALHSAQSLRDCERLQAQIQQLEAEKQRAEEANRAKSQFLSVMNHELRSPLTGIIGFSRMLGEEIYGKLNPKQTQYVSAIVESGEYLLELINDLLDISKIEAEREELYLETVAVEDVCLSSLSIVQERARQAGLELKLEIDANVSFCTADQRRLKQILVNLLSNAVKFTEAGGTVTLRVRKEKTLQFSVIDTGIGISKADQKKLFQPFAQIHHHLNRKHKGTGLGLALSRKLAQLHEGDLTLVSEAGKGSCFTIHLPIVG